MLRRNTGIATVAWTWCPNEFSGNQKHRIYGGRYFRFIYGTGFDKKNRKLKRISKITVYADSFGGQISDLCNRILYETWFGAGWKSLKATGF